MSAESATSGQWECDGSGSLTSVRHRDTGLGCSGGATGGIGADSCGWQKRTGRHRAATRTTGTGLSVSGPRRRQVTTGRFSVVSHGFRPPGSCFGAGAACSDVSSVCRRILQSCGSCRHHARTSTVRRRYRVLSFCHSVIPSFCHSLTLSLSHSVILSFSPISPFLPHRLTLARTHTASTATKATNCS